MDVYARVLINKREIYPIIFENKTNTFLHNDQLERYCDLVYRWFWDKPEKALEDQKKDICNHKIIVDSTIDFSEIKICNTQYLLFKSSYIFKWEENEFEVLSNNYYKKKGKTDFHLRKLEDMKILLDKILVDKNEIRLIADYRNYIEKKIESEKTDSDWDNWKNKKDGFEKALNSHLGQWKFFEACDAEDINCQSNSGLWSSYSIGKSLEKVKDNPDTINYFFRYGWRKGEKAVYLQQFRKEKEVTNKATKDKRQEEYDSLSSKLKKIYSNNTYEVICDFENSKRGVDGKEVFRIVFDEDKNTPENVALFIKNFTEEFNTIPGEVRKEI